MHRRVQAVDRDQADRRVLRPVALGRHVALAGVDGELHADLGALVEMAQHQLGIEDHDVADGLDVAGRDDGRARLLHHHALGPVALHLDGDVLDVEHDVGHVLAHAGDRGEFVQHAVDVHRLHARALQRREENAPQRVAERQAEAALERLGHHGGRALRIGARRDLQLVRPDQFLPVLLDRHVNHPFVWRARSPRIPLRPWENSAAADGRCRPAGCNSVRRAGACAAGSRCAGSASRRGST